MADFSNIRRQWPDIIGRAYARGELTTDEMFVESLEVINPPLLSTKQAEPVLRILRRQRGRPHKDEPSRGELARSVLQIDRPGVPRGFLAALADRLLLVRRQNIWHNSRRRLAECRPRLGLMFRRRACGVASADIRVFVA